MEVIRAPQATLVGKAYAARDHGRIDVRAFCADPRLPLSGSQSVKQHHLHPFLQVENHFGIKRARMPASTISISCHDPCRVFHEASTEQHHQRQPRRPLSSVRLPANITSNSWHARFTNGKITKHQRLRSYLRRAARLSAYCNFQTHRHSGRPFCFLAYVPAMPSPPSRAVHV